MKHSLRINILFVLITLTSCTTYYKIKSNDGNQVYDVFIKKNNTISIKNIPVKGYPFDFCQEKIKIGKKMKYQACDSSLILVDSVFTKIDTSRNCKGEFEYFELFDTSKIIKVSAFYYYKLKRIESHSMINYMEY